jgi:hypothetical protein
MRALFIHALVALLPTTAACTVVSQSSDGGSDSGTSSDSGTGTDTGVDGGVDSGVDSGSASDTGSSIDSGPAKDGGADAQSAEGGDAASGLLPFTPSNIVLSGIDISQIADEDVSSTCQIRTGEGAGTDCFSHPGDGVAIQSDGSKIHVIVVKSLRVEPQAHINLSSIQGNLPLAIVSLGDFTLLGTIDGRGFGGSPSGGGFTATSNTKGSGPGGGAASTSSGPGYGAGGGSYCGQGGQGALEMGGMGPVGAKAPAYGTPGLVPILGGSAGGGGAIGGGAGGSALHLVAGGTFTMGSASWVNVGGGAGPQAGTGGQEAGGGGSGGSLLIEATTVKIAGTLAANGGGGGGAGASASDGHDATPDVTPAAGGTGDSTGGSGSAGTAIDGASAAAASVAAPGGGGGGGSGRIRINSKTAQADLTGATLSPAATTSCVSQGMLK